MFEAIIASLPPGWREAAGFLFSVVAWLPAWQARLLEFLLAGRGVMASIAVWLLLLLPALLLIVAMWTTMVSVYTLPFRSGRAAYIRTLAFGWWDAGRGVAVFWGGIARFVLVAVGLLWSTVRYLIVLAGKIIGQLFATPAAALDWTARKYFKPGVPWVAFVLILGWSALEALVFTFTLRPTMYEVLYDLTGAPPNPAFMTPILFMLLFLLIAGSFACIQVLTEAIERRRAKEIIQMLFVELFVMFFEVVFLYRELIDAVTPWIAQQTGEQVRLGLWSTLALASFGWIGIRGMTWFLFGRFGTPALMAILSRQTLSLDEASQPGRETAMAPWWRDMVADFKRELDWLHATGKQLAEAAVLPILQLLAAALNFCLIVVSGRPAFELPFASLDEAMERLPKRTVTQRPTVQRAQGQGLPRPAEEV